MRGNIRGNTWKLTEVSRYGAMALVLVLATAGGVGLAWGQAAKPATYHNFEIRAGELATALLQFADQSGVQVLFEADLVTGLKAPAVRGRWTADEALARLLKDSALERAHVNGSTVVLKRAPGAAPAEAAPSAPPPTGTLTGRVTQAGEPAAGVTVTATSESLAGSRVATTDERGTYRLSPLPPGTYSIRFELEGLAPVTKEVRVSPDQTTTLDVQMSLHEVSEEMVVTGSRIRRAEVEGPSPVIFLTREDLDRSGRATVAEALALLPQNYTPTWVAGTFIGGGSRTVNLRGLGTDNTLVLVNGRRVANSGIGLGAFTTQVDLDSIPLAAVERIEVMTDGASALYGSDAVAGVVNVILKEDFRGTDVSIDYGTSAEGGASERHYSFTTGGAKGNLRGLVSGEYFNRNRLSAADRAFSRSDDRRARGGRDGRFTFSNPGNVFSLDGQNLPGLDAPSAGIPAGQDGRNLTPADFVATAGQLNLQSFNSFADLIPDQERWGLNGRLDWQLGSALTLFAEAAATHNEKVAVFLPANLTVDVPAGNPFNPFGVDVRVQWVAIDMGSRPYPTESDNVRTSLGLSGRVGSRGSWESSLSYSRDEFDTPGFVNPSSAAVQAAVNRTSPDNALNVFADGPGGNPAEVLAELAASRIAIVDGVGDLFVWEGKVDGVVARLADRELRAAAGVEYREEGLEWVGLNIQDNAPPVPVAPPIDGDRELAAGFVELSLPLFGPEHQKRGLRVLELQLAGRFETYSDFGETANPKLALRWQPIASLALRGSLGTGFRAPSLQELLLVPTPFATIPIFDPRRNETAVATLISGGNPDLEPEESQSWNLGLVWDVPLVPRLELTVDAYDIRQDDQISSLQPSNVLENEASLPSQVIRAERTPGDIAAGLPGRLLAIDTSSLNISQARVRGLDFGTRYTHVTTIGRFDWGVNASYVDSLTRQLIPSAPVEELAGKTGTNLFDGFSGNPARFRGNLSLFWSRGAWQIGLTERYTGRVRETVTASPTFGQHIDDHLETDLQWSYRWPGTAGPLAGSRLALSVENVFNEEPPFRDAGFGFHSGLHSPRQAFYHLTLTKSFGRTTP